MKGTIPAPDIARTLELDGLSQGRARLKRWLVWGAIVLVCGAGGAWWWAVGRNHEVRYTTQDARRGNLVVTVTATGVLEPTTTVDVSSEISGILRTVTVDYNDRVKVGQVLATLDSATQRAKVSQSQAALASAKAKVLQAQATVLETRKALERARSLAAKNALSAQDLDTAVAAATRAKADEAMARAGVVTAQATLEADRVNLTKTVIKSPINGIVLKRNVEPGQTVAASLQAPVLFTLAEDLTRMELSVDVDEADVGRVKVGQHATFNVDAYPDRSFPAQITAVHYASQTVDGVVTYETLLRVNNAKLLLRPGMTATANIVVDRLNDALLVPNAALRFAPPSEPQPAVQAAGLAPSAAAKHRVWTLRAGKPVAIPVTVGESDGQMTAVTSGDVQPGMALLTDVAGSRK